MSLDFTSLSFSSTTCLFPNVKYVDQKGIFTLTKRVVKWEIKGVDINQDLLELASLKFSISQLWISQYFTWSWREKYKVLKWDSLINHGSIFYTLSSYFCVKFRGRQFYVMETINHGYNCWSHKIEPPVSHEETIN